MKCIRRIVVVLIIILSFATTVYANDTETYSLISYDKETSETIYTTDSYNEAYNFYISNTGNYRNLCLLENDETLFMEYGTLYIDSDEDVVTYYSLIDECEKALSNYNEYELLYLNEEFDNVRFAIKGDIGLIRRDEVEYYPYTTYSVSFYDCLDDSLVYHVASSTNNYYKYNLKLDVFPEFLEKDKKYYSNDVHYFYDDFYTMCDDYYYGINDNAVNDEPYYNYYAYLPSRSYTNYTFSELNNFFTNTLGIKGRLNSFVDFDKDGANDVVNRSEYYNNINAFTSAEKIYGVNALTSLAWSSEESSFGKSKNAFINSNVYNHEALSGFERENNKYSSVKSSIYSHISNYVSQKYCDEFSSLYIGSHIGDFMSGIASIYSHDPLFSDKVVSKVYFYDSSLGLKDRNTYSIGITDRSITLYYDKDLVSSFNTIKTTRGYSFIILDEFDDGYKIQCDYSRNQTGEYNPEECVAYVKKNRVDRVLEGNRINPEYHKYVVDTSETEINLFSINDYDVTNEFVYKDIEGTEMKKYYLENDIYVPNVKKIKTIKGKNFTYPSINNNGIVFNEEKLLVEFEDGSSENKNLCSDYILSSSNQNTTTSIDLIYNGVKDSIKIDGNFIVDGNNNINDFKVKNDYYYSDYSFGDVEKFDTTFDISDENDISTYVRENDYDLNVAGAYPSFIYHSKDRLADIINTYYFDIKNIRSNGNIDSIVSPYGLEFVDAFDVSISRCFYKIDLVSPIIMQVKIPHSNDQSVYTVYYRTKNGDIIKVPTQFSENYIKFLAIDDGSYYVYKALTASTYLIDDNRLIVNMDSNGVDYYSVAEEGIRLFVVSALGYLLYAVYVVIKRREDRTWKDFKKLLQQAESVQEEKQSN